MVTEGDSNIVISVPGDNGDQARRARPDRAAALPAGHHRPRAGRARDQQRDADADGRRGAPTDAAATPHRRGADPGRRVADRRRRDAVRRCGRRPLGEPGRSRGHPGAGDGGLRHPHLRQRVARHGGPRPRTTWPPAARTAASSTCSARPSSRAPTSPTPTPAPRQGTGEWIVQLDFNNAGTAAWAEYTARQHRQAGRHHPRRQGHLRADDQLRHQRRHRDLRQLQPDDGHRAGQPAQVRRAAAELHPGDRPVDLDRARRRAAAGRPDRRRDRHRAGVPLRADLLPPPRPGHDRQPRARPRPSSTRASCCWAARSGSP